MSAQVVGAEEITLVAARDNTIFSEAGVLSNGAGEHCFAGNTNFSQFARRALLAFDVAQHVPAGATITDARLTLHMSRTNAGPVAVSLHQLTFNWGEAGSDAEGEEGAGVVGDPGDATWTEAFFGSVPWGTPGGDFDAPVSAQTVVSGIGFYTWQSAGLATDVQQMLDDPFRDFGWIVIGDESTVRTAKRFDTRENPVSAYRPKLIITFTPPPTSGACCLPDTNCIVASPADCAGQNGQYQGGDVPCTPGLCAAPSGACCFVDGACDELTATACAAAGGVYQGDEATCAPNPCPQPIGACCHADGSCTESTADACDGGGGEYQGDGTTCTPGLCPIALEPYVDALPVPPVLQPVSGEAGGPAHYEVAMTEFQQQLHRDLPPTTVWGFAGSYPGPTIEAGRDQPVTVTWVNDIRDENGELRTVHYLPVDLCPHGPDHLGPSPRTVVHLHGGHVPAEFDGYPENTFLPGESVTYEYPNNQLPATLWYHDHALGITRLNVYLGLAGFYLVRDAFESKLSLPAGEYEVPMVIQDRSFHSDGSFEYPAYWQDHFFGDFILVNGKVWPYFQVKRGLYRFRVLNGSNGRTYTLSLSNGQPFQLIGTDGGLLPAPQALTEITLGPAERADLVIDFSAQSADSEILLTNSAPAPFPGTPGIGVIPQVMKFVVADQPGYTTPLPVKLRPMEALVESEAVQFRQFMLQQSPEPCTGSYWLINGLEWDDITEYPQLASTEVWSFINASATMHPMHMHLVMFQVLDHQAFELVDGEVVPIGAPRPPGPSESGWKDTVKVRPLEITRVIARFEDYTGKFAYHCHVLEHEDHEMMRQFRVVLHGDYDEDGDVDLDDYAHWVDCVTGPENGPFAEGCHAFDFDADWDIDHHDFGAFQRALPER